ncbi:MAG: hypothetical protein IIA66_03755 [Planctomycetes bacterium]|nr:hypothetical protein [Planctomycetota bacterium]
MTNWSILPRRPFLAGNTRWLAGNTRWLAAAVVLPLVCLTAKAEDRAVTLIATSAESPKEIAEPIRAVLQKSVLRLTDKDGPLLEFWFRQALPLSQAPVPGRFVFEFETLPEGALIGVLRVHKERRDFRDEEIPPGVYTLRLGLQPEDGDHLGTSPTRYFAVLSPSKLDRKLKGISGHDHLARISSKVNAAGHPSTMNLQPVRNKEGQFPRLAEHHQDHKLVYLQIPGRIEGQDKPVVLRFGIVYQGTGEI